MSFTPNSQQLGPGPNSPAGLTDAALPAASATTESDELSTSSRSAARLRAADAPWLRLGSA